MMGAALCIGTEAYRHVAKPRTGDEHGFILVYGVRHPVDGGIWDTPKRCRQSHVNVTTTISAGCWRSCHQQPEKEHCWHQEARSERNPALRW